MSFHSSDEAKSYAVTMTSHRQSDEESQRSLQYFSENRDKSEGDSKQFWAGKIAELENWISSAQCQSGDYPQGIDDLMLELIEWRAAIYAHQHVDTKSTPFIDHIFFQQWLVGAIYAMHSLLGKLVGNDPRENSLRNLWWKVNKFIARDGACKPPELKFIETQLHKVTGQFTNGQSKSMLVRNAVVAHNEKNLKVNWDEIDADIRVLVRIWSIVVSWSSFGIVSPFRPANQAFAGLEFFFDAEEMLRLAQKRQEYLDKCISWARTHLHDGLLDPGGYFIAKITVTSKPVGA